MSANLLLFRSPISLIAPPFIVASLAVIRHSRPETSPMPPTSPAPGDSFSIPLAGFGMENESPGAGLVGGIGLVSGRECLITANEATMKGGAISEIGLRKSKRLADIAVQN